VTLQVEVVVPGVRVQGFPVKLPLAEPFENVTVPPGADLVPKSESETVTEQVVDWLMATLAGEQPVTDVVVERVVTVTPEPVVSALSAWTASSAV
jgi:hypothetical protein